MSKKGPKQVFERRVTRTVYTPSQIADHISAAKDGERRMIEGFVAAIAAFADQDGAGRLEAYVLRRGWKRDGAGNFAKSGVSLHSEAGCLCDPAAWSAADAIASFRMLSAVVREAKPEALLGFQLAFETGSKYAEFVSQAKRLENAGRPASGIKERRFQALRQAAKTGRKMRGGETLWDLIPDQGLRPRSAKTEQNLLSEFCRVEASRK